MPQDRPPAWAALLGSLRVFVLGLKPDDGGG